MFQCCSRSVRSCYFHLITNFLRSGRILPYYTYRFPIIGALRLSLQGAILSLMQGTLYLVSTPIGNLDDITLRAIQTLRRVDLIACEDTRHTRKLLDHHGISTPTLSCHEHNESARLPQLLVHLASGQSIALVSDAGTPLISDPGFRLVQAAIAAGTPVVPIPGPNAAIAALTASGLPTDSFYFAGFLPPKDAQRRKRLAELTALQVPVILYEAPHRILDTLDALHPDHPVVLARELTKVHEEILRGPASAVRANLAARPAIKGEITLLLSAFCQTNPPHAPTDPAAEVASLIASGTPRMDAIKEVARRHSIGKRDLYKLLT
jgi:16S rRNA (cytidine1402-2'-O)-methyltransferase